MRMTEIENRFKSIENRLKLLEGSKKPRPLYVVDDNAKPIENKVPCTKVSDQDTSQDQEKINKEDPAKKLVKENKGWKNGK